MSWFEVSSVFRNIQSSFLNSITNNNKVIEEKQLKYTDCAVICREEDLILYQNQTSSDIKYDIVLLRPHSDQAYSLHRSKELDEAQCSTLLSKTNYLVGQRDALFAD
ncbi:uncharacterized protein LOC120356045 [Nilaparvata lugens]|uniref:uncharacterized protein LOC120356045 n=1 Tax=Nilaparvata lugens TaxID=108931 RepID=UPI00193E87A0|nr:uncharacterized protein LOC120356045 [Nilaparvata lugens]